ncbi:erythromycin esterase family protein [Streptomyces sp. CBMA152]|uniref:erythromycin esterase family protein n=1 Tax=Streptomyces sp. CBMA152 TaxID=1896312 RepID=UPI00166042D1|nr:erythromycin esterase family protein [Streptomyces sp. CBMA152]MBD0744303.1 erythromycin esterase [Streptomyces sp. CBMA152]
MYLFTETHRRLRQSLLLLLGLTLGVFTTAIPGARAQTPTPERQLARSAQPFTDLGPLGRMTGSAEIVGLGEATHNSHEFFAAKHRVFQYLVEHKGFTTFALETPWSSGMRINDYVRHGKGDPERIVREEFQSSYAMWDTREYLDLIRWMRQYNLHHTRQLQFMGDDMGYAGTELFDKVTAYTARQYPALLARVTALYKVSRPTAGVGDTMAARIKQPLDQRRRQADDVRKAYDLLSEQRPGPDRAEHDWVLQYARTIAQTGTMWSYDFFDDAQLRESRRFRDETMAGNTVWWQRHTGDKMLLSAHDGHVGYAPTLSADYPKTQGAYIRELVGTAYTTIGFTFGQGSFNAMDMNDPAEPIRKFTVGPMAPGSNEATLERVSPHDYYLDMRTVPAAAKKWLDAFRPTRLIGNSWPEPIDQVRLGASFDVLVHLHRVTAAHRL